MKLTQLITIRDLELADICQREEFFACLSQIAPCKLSVKAMWDLYFDRQHLGMRTIVAAMGSFISGTASLIIEPKFIHNGGRCGHVEDVAVYPNFQGRGIGRMLINKIIQIATEGKCYKLLLNCNDDVVGFYKKLGFSKTPNNMRLDLV